MKAIPGRKGLPFIGSALSILAAGGPSKLHLYVDKRHKEYGPIFKEKLGSINAIFISDVNYMRKIFAGEGKYPKHIIPEPWLLYNQIYGCKRGLLFMDGQEWLSFRKLLNPMFLKVDQFRFYEPVFAVVDDLLEDWKKGEQIIDLEKRLYKWSLEVIVAVLLGKENYLKNKENLTEMIEKVGKTLHEIFIETANLSSIPPNLAIKLKLPVWKRFVKAVSSTMEEATKLIEKLLEIENQNSGTINILSQMINSNIQLIDIKRIVTDLVLAAGDTSAHTMQWLLHFLSQDLQCQQNIYNELCDLPEKEFFQSSLLKGALKETLRLSPVAPFITRFLPQEFVLDNYLLKPEDLILMSLYTSGRNKTYFSNPQTFLPQRWIRNGKSYDGVFNANAYLPFAMGSRSCVGKKLAETQILITTAQILRKFVVKSENKKRIEITLHLITVPAEPVKLFLEPRGKTI